MSNRWQRAGGGSYNPAAPKPARRFGAPGAAQREYQASEEQRNRAAYIASAKAKSQKTRGYFDDSDDDEDDELLRETNAGDDGDDDVDPLDAFMAQNDAQVKAPAPKRPRPERLDESARDAVDDAAAEAVARERAAAEKPVEDAKAGDDRGDDVRYVDGKAVVQNAKKRKIDGLAPVDHRAATYETVDHAFLDLAAWNAAGAAGPPSGDVAACADGTTVRPAASFSELFGAAPAASWLLKAVAKFGFERPTPVQALAAPAALAGRDVLALAETGSGKTLAYGWPLLAHCARQRPSEAGEGPLGLVLCPTRELCEQIYRELLRFSRHAPRREPVSYTHLTLPTKRIV